MMCSHDSAELWVSLDGPLPGLIEVVGRPKIPKVPVNHVLRHQGTNLEVSNSGLADASWSTELSRTRKSRYASNFSVFLRSFGSVSGIKLLQNTRVHLNKT